MKRWRPEGWVMPISITFYNGDAAYEMGADDMLKALKIKGVKVEPETELHYYEHGKGTLVFIPEE